MSEAQFASKHPGVVSVRIKAPADDSNPAWGLVGQVLVLEVGSVMRSVKELKEQLSSMLGEMPGNKMQLKHLEQGVFLKDTQSLASYNLGDPDSPTVLELSVRSRGGRK